MEIRPGIVTSRENAKNQLPLPDDVKHASEPLPGRGRRAWPRPANSASVDAVQPRLAASGRATHEAEDRPGDGDGREHRHEHAEDQDQARSRGYVDEPNRNRIVAVMRLDTFESRIEFQARLKPASTAAGRLLPTPQLFLHPLEDEDVGVDRHAHREHEARDAGQRQRDGHEAEQRVA